MKSSLFFLHSVSKKAKESSEDFIVNVIKLVLFSLSRKSFSQDNIKDKVSSSLEDFLYLYSHQRFQNKQFSVLNLRPMKAEIQVRTYVYSVCMFVCINICTFYACMCMCFVCLHM